jgi:hypothetical protein
VRTAEWAIAAEPMPASFEKAARRNPRMSAPSAPPLAPSEVKAPRTIQPIAVGSSVACTAITTRPA